MLGKIRTALARIEDLSNMYPIKVISHFDTDGITSAAIFSRALQRKRYGFSLQIVKNLDEKTIASLPENALLIFLDLASGSLNYLKNKKNQIIIFDHHEIVQEIPSNVLMINPVLEGHEQISSAGIAYLVAKELSLQNTSLASLAIIGMVGDTLEKNIGKVYDEILKDSGTIIKKGLLLYPSTRPLDKALEYSANPYIPHVTGSPLGVLEVLREAGIPKINGRFKALYELTDEEMGKLITVLLIRCANEKKAVDIIGNLFLVKFFNKLEDARELSALINACSRMDHPDTALGLCLGSKQYKEEAERLYASYKQNLVAALRYATESEKIAGKNYAIIHGKDAIKDTIIGTVASIISNSPTYKEGTIIIALAYTENKIKVSARIVGKQGRNVREVLHQAVLPLGGEVGGHPNAAGCIIAREKENAFIEELQRVLEIECVKV